jgi:hypothetical protein
MIKVTSVLALAALALGLSSASFASHTFGVTNDDNPNAGANTATVFTITGANTIGVFKTLAAGGSGLGGGYFSAPRNSIEQNASCVFVANVASSTIAAFSKASHFAAVPGSPFAGIGNSDFEGMGLAASADGAFLYAAFSGSDQIGSYAIGTGANACVLTPLSGPISAGDAVSPLAITSDGQTLLVSELNNEFLDSYAVTAGVIAATATSHESTSSCGFPGGVDVTKVTGGSANVVTGEATLSQTYCTATLTAGVLGAVSGNTLLAPTGLGNLESPVFNKAAYTTGTGLIFMGFSGFGGGGTGTFADAGFAINPVTAGAINNTPNASFDAFLTTSNTYLYGTNPGISTVGTVTGVWQSYATSSVTNIVTLYKVVGNTISVFGSMADPNANGTSFVLSISSFPGR